MSVFATEWSANSDVGLRDAHGRRVHTQMQALTSKRSSDDAIRSCIATVFDEAVGGRLTWWISSGVAPQRQSDVLGTGREVARLPL